jgi:steroid delta-isomerase-like uncharacterized protein
MTRDEILQLLSQRAEAWAAHDPAALAATHAPDGVVRSPFGGVLEERSEIERIYRLWFAALPDIKLHVDEVLIDGQRAVQIGRVAATHSGDFFGVPATGRHVEAPLALLLIFADGLVAEERRIYDFTGILVQAGVLKAKPTV